MKAIKNIAIGIALLMGVSSCIDKEPDYSNFATKDVDFTYNVDGDEYTLDFYVVSTIQFNNTSSKTGTGVTWDFGDGNTSTEANPLHKYDEAGLYQVKLTVAGVGSCTYPLLIYDIAPQMSVAEQSADEIVINDVDVLLQIALPNPENLICRYEWTFPDGTLDENGEIITSFTGYSHEDGTIDNPGRISFRNIGSQRVELQTWFDINGENRRLEDAYVNVQVGYNKEVPTVYYAVLDGNIKAYKIIEESELPEGTRNLPFDMGVSSGSTPMQLVCATTSTSDAETGEVTETDYIYILDAGSQYTYINDESDTNGDGRITVMSADGTYADVVVTNVGRQAFNDPFQGCTDGTYLYYTDRNTGIRQIELTARGTTETTQYESTANYLVTNSQLGYYSNAGQGGNIVYGAGNSDIVIDSKGVFYWAKSFNGAGVYRFTRSNINDLSSLPYPQMFTNTAPRSIAIDEARNKFYIWQRRAYPIIGFLQYDLPNSISAPVQGDATVRIAMAAEAGNNTTDEGLYVTQLSVDEETGNVWFGFRAGDGESNYTNGLYYFDYETNKMVKYCDNNENILGVTINPRKTRLF